MSGHWSGTKGRTPEERFWEKVNKDGPIPEHRPELGPCWIWTAHTVAGYGHFFLDGKDRRATHVAYEWACEPVPAGLFVCHHCDRPACVRPSHLFIGTTDDNMRDMVTKGRSPRGDRHSSRTHPESLLRGEDHHQAKLTEENVREIRERFALGQSVNSIKGHFGVAYRTVWMVVHYITWKEVA